MLDRAVHVGLILALTIRGLAVASYETLRDVARTAEALAFDQATEYIDADHPDVVARARALTRDCRTDRERLERIHYFVRELPYDILASFAYLAEGRRRASDASSTASTTS